MNDAADGQRAHTAVRGAALGLDRRQPATGCPTSTRRSGATPSRPGASTAPPATMSSCCAPRASTSRRARAGCRPPSPRELGHGRAGAGGFSEYDAVPGNSQQAVPHQAPREGLHPYAAGHTDPHSMLGIAALAGVLAREGGDGGARRAGHAQALRRAGGEGLRLQADPRRQGLLRWPRRRRRLASLALQHGDGRDAFRRLLERRVHLRGRDAGALDRPDPDARSRARTPRRAAPARSTRCA